MNDFFNRIPNSIIVLAIALSLFMNLINVNLTRQVANDDRSNVVLLCKRTHPTSHVVNVAHQTFRDVLQNSIDNALKRINTPKELPSDKETIRKNTEFLKKFQTAPAASCKGFK